MKFEELKTILTEHRKWLEGEAGKQANLSEADLSGANLRQANLIGANLIGASLDETNFGGADLSGADLRRVNLSGSNLRGANLIGANLKGANLSGADLSGANLRGADFRVANLEGANLKGANLSGVGLSGAGLGGAKNLYFQIPQEGSMTVWKKLKGGVVAKLKVPAKARRTATPTGRKCRAEFVKVLGLWDVQGSPVKWGYSIYDLTPYLVGDVVYPDSYCDDWRLECANGIHFFLTREEAEEY